MEDHLLFSLLAYCSLRTSSENPVTLNETNSCFTSQSNIHINGQLSRIHAFSVIADLYTLHSILTEPKRFDHNTNYKSSSIESRTRHFQHGSQTTTEPNLDAAFRYKIVSSGAAFHSFPAILVIGGSLHVRIVFAKLTTHSLERERKERERFFHPPPVPRQSTYENTAGS